MAPSAPEGPTTKTSSFDSMLIRKSQYGEWIKFNEEFESVKILNHYAILLEISFKIVKKVKN